MPASPIGDAAGPTPPAGPVTLSSADRCLRWAVQLLETEFARQSEHGQGVERRSFEADLRPRDAIVENCALLRRVDELEAATKATVGADLHEQSE